MNKSSCFYSDTPFKQVQNCTCWSHLVVVVFFLSSWLLGHEFNHTLAIKSHPTLTALGLWHHVSPDPHAFRLVVIYIGITRSLIFQVSGILFWIPIMYIDSISWLWFRVWLTHYCKLESFTVFAIGQLQNHLFLFQNKVFSSLQNMYKCLKNLKSESAMRSDIGLFKFHWNIKKGNSCIKSALNQINSAKSSKFTCAASSSLKIQLRSITSDRTLTSLKRGPKKSWNPKSY